MHKDSKEREKLAIHHSKIFAKQNPRFDHAKFMKASGSEPKK